MSIAPASENQLDLHDELIFMLRNDPHVRGSLSRLQNSCVNVSMQWQEGGKDLVAPLDRHMRTHFDAFLRQAVEMCVYTGFVPFFVRRTKSSHECTLRTCNTETRLLSDCSTAPIIP